MKYNKHKLVYLSFIVIIVIILIVLGFFYYASSKFKIGELVYKKNGEILIGEVKGVSIPFTYLVQWQSEDLTDESVFDIEKLSELEDFEIEEVLEDEESENQLDVFSKDIKGRMVVSSDILEMSDEELTEEGIYNIMLGDGTCVPNFVCGKWQKCQSEYDLHVLIVEGIVSGVQYRNCKDSKGCMADFVDSRRCSQKEEIELKRTTIDGQDYIEVYDLKGKIIGSLKETQFEDFKRLDIEFDI